MTIDQSRLRATRERWEAEKKISGSDVRWLLDIAKAVATTESADRIDDLLNRRAQTRKDSFYDALFDQLGRKP